MLVADTMKTLEKLTFKWDKKFRKYSPAIKEPYKILYRNTKYSKETMIKESKVKHRTSLYLRVLYKRTNSKSRSSHSFKWWFQSSNNNLFSLNQTDS